MTNANELHNIAEQFLELQSRLEGDSGELKVENLKLNLAIQLSKMNGFLNWVNKLKCPY